MTIKKSIILLSLALSLTQAFAHKGEKKHHIIIDTDCAIDDLRAISFFLSSSQFEVLAITTNDGALSPEQGFKKVNALLKYYHHEGIPTAAGRKILKQGPKWRDMSLKAYWGETSESKTNNSDNAVDLIIKTVKNEDEPVEIIALGPLTNIMDAHKSFPKLTDEINDTIAWYNPGIKPETGIYYNDDPAAFQYLIQQGDLFFKAIHNKESKDYAIDDNFLQKTKNIDSPYAQLIAESHYDSLIYRKIKISHLKLWDDMIVAYILNPNLFNTKTNKSHPNLMNIIPMKDARNDIIQLLYDALSNPNTSLIFEHFPTDKSYFQDDVKSVLEQIIQQHGKTEWGICVLTNEFHGHLGVYSLIGAKMGLRAREYYNIGKDDFYISSFAGTHPPVSCMNDGLQLSTGATLGHGLIKANDTDNPIPSATFKFKNNVIKLTLKKKYHERVKKIIKTCSKEENYWPVLRKYALQLWLDFDRHEMFIIEEVNNNKLANHE